MTPQYLEQLLDDLQSAVIGDITSITAFRLVMADAKIVAEEFYRVFTVDDFINLTKSDN